MTPHPSPSSDIAARIRARLPGPEVAPPGTTCPTCGLDVSGYLVGETDDGRPLWERPHYVAAGTGAAAYHGGLTHVQDGERCRPGLKRVL